jgi:Protein of unknown function (DUF3489)
MNKKSKSQAKRKAVPSHKTPKVAVARVRNSARAPHPSRAHLSERAPSVRSGTKIESMVAMLRRSGGASIEALAKATGWQVHSVRGAISGTLKKKLGLVVVSDKTGAVRLYRIDGDPAV